MNRRLLLTCAIACGVLGAPGSARGDVGLDPNARYTIGSSLYRAHRGRVHATPLDVDYPTLIEDLRAAPRPDVLAPGLVALRGLESAPWARQNANRVNEYRYPTRLGLSLVPRLSLIGLQTDPKRQLHPIDDDVRARGDVDPSVRARAGLSGRLLLHDRVTAGVEFAFDTAGENDPRNRTREFDQLGASNNFDAAWLRADFDTARLTLGRIPFQWGPERLGGLLISHHAPAFDMLHAALDWGPHVLQSFAGQLSKESIDEVGLRRWLYGHRVDLYFDPPSRVFDSLRLGLSETLLVSGPGESLSLRYLNPIPLWAQIQVEDDGEANVDANAINAIDFTADFDLRHRRWFRSIRTYGSLAVDDLQIDAEGRDRAPDQLAWTIGAQTPVVFVRRSTLHLEYEYRRVGSWTFLHRGDGTSHTTFGRPLGAPEGPDTDRHNLRVSWRVRPLERVAWQQHPGEDPLLTNLRRVEQETRDGPGLWTVYAEVERRRRGENRTLTTESRIGNAGQSYPRGVVESRWIATLGAHWEVPRLQRDRWRWRLQGHVAFHAIENVNNIENADLDVFEVRVGIDILFPELIYRAVRPGSSAPQP